MTSANEKHNKCVAVAMSGGLDSSVAAALLKEQGYEVFGVTARMWPCESRCCSDADVRSARAAAERIGIAHHTVDLLKYFERDVVRDFVDEYARGRTPSPCAVCNPTIKFGVLMDQAFELGADFLATGHYARIEPGDGGNFRLLRGLDSGKDQSYFLFGLSQAQLRHTFFPLGRMTKPEARELAVRFGLGEAMVRRSESQDLCFVAPGEHWKLVEAYHPEIERDGRFIDPAGNELGRHRGIHRYTIGQRRGLGVAAAHPLYVAEIRAASGDIVLAERESLYSTEVLVERVNWTCGIVPSVSFPASAKVRYRQNAAPVEVQPLATDTVCVRFRAPQFAVTPGQAAVFYDGDAVVGGGWIR